MQGRRFLTSLVKNIARPTSRYCPKCNPVPSVGPMIVDPCKRPSYLGQWPLDLDRPSSGQVIVDALQRPRNRNLRFRLYQTKIVRDLHCSRDFPPTFPRVENSSEFASSLPRVLSSTVKIYTVARCVSDENRPWVTPYKSSSSGSGFVISDKRIITNAHCVSGNTLVEVKSPLSGTLFKAKILAFGHIADLALLTVEDSVHCCLPLQMSLTLLVILRVVTLYQ